MQHSRNISFWKKNIKKFVEIRRVLLLLKFFDNIFSILFQFRIYLFAKIFTFLALDKLLCNLISFSKFYIFSLFYWQVCKEQIFIWSFHFFFAKLIFHNSRILYFSKEKTFLKLFRKSYCLSYLQLVFICYYYLI